jgi:hypothetical protein
LLLEPFLSVAMFLQVPCFVLHENIVLSQLFKFFGCGLQSRRFAPRSKFSGCQRLPSIPSERIRRPSPIDDALWVRWRNWVILRVGKDIFANAAPWALVSSTSSRAAVSKACSAAAKLRTLLPVLCRGSAIGLRLAGGNSGLAPLPFLRVCVFQHSYR